VNKSSDVDMEAAVDEKEDPTVADITFLYSLVVGPSSDGLKSSQSSYGFFTAKIAGLPRELIRNAYAASRMLGSEADAVHKLRELKLAAARDDDEALLARVAAAV